MKYFSFFKLAGLALVILISSSCFDVKEEFFFRKDGSGSAKITVDMSSMIEMMQMFSSMADSSEEGEDPMASLDEAFSNEDAIDALKDLAGISNIKNLNDKDAGLIGYSFDFADLDVLNKAMGANNNDLALTAAMGLGEETASNETLQQFERKGRKFSRVHSVDAAVEQRLKDEKNEEDEEEIDAEQMAGMMFGEASYSIVYKFEEGVKKCKSDVASISGDGKSVIVDVNMKDLLMGDVSLSTKIKTR